jgi:hypothetical protein
VHTARQRSRGTAVRRTDLNIGSAKTAMPGIHESMELSMRKLIENDLVDEAYLHGFPLALGRISTTCLDDIRMRSTSD